MLKLVNQLNKVEKSERSERHEPSEPSDPIVTSDPRDFESSFCLCVWSDLPTGGGCDSRFDMSSHRPLKKYPHIGPFSIYQIMHLRFKKQYERKCALSSMNYSLFEIL